MWLFNFIVFVVVLIHICMLVYVLIQQTKELIVYIKHLINKQKRRCADCIHDCYPTTTSLAFRRAWNCLNDKCEYEHNYIHKQWKFWRRK